MSHPSGQRRVAITYHYSLSFGGSERVLEVLAEMYPEADFFALFVDPAFIPEKLRGRKIVTSFLDRFPARRRFYRHLLPLYPLAVECLDLSGYDLVISADGAATKGVLTDQDAVHLCYCHSPPRSFWDQYAVQRRSMSWPARALFALVSQYLRLWDFAAAQRIDGFIANSGYVADRIQKYYRRPSTVIHPPVDTRVASPSSQRGDYYLAVGRLVPGKRTDLIISACNRLGRKLCVVGTGPEEAALRALAGPSISFLGTVDDPKLKQHYAACRALLFAADEDFGLVSVEAQSCGTPVIAYGRGGSLETILGSSHSQSATYRERREKCAQATGIFFPEQSASSLIAAMLDFESLESCFDRQLIQAHARRFDTSVFISQMRSYVDDQVRLRQESCRKRLPVYAAADKSPGLPSSEHRWQPPVSITPQLHDSRTSSPPQPHTQ